MLKLAANKALLAQSIPNCKVYKRLLVVAVKSFHFQIAAKVLIIWELFTLMA
jgi:hypothetical protein